MTINTIKITDPTLDSFYKNNPDFDILHFDFINQADAGSLKLGEPDKDATLQKLMAYQRLLRVTPSPEAAVTLYENAMDSAHKITSISQTQFIKEFGSKLEGGSTEARQVYQNANAMKTQTMHLWANVNHLKKSPYFMNLAASPALQNTTELFENLSSYQQIFGSLNYCDCPECKSILGPAAYLTDLLRLIDKAITKSNTDIPKGLTFNDRRPDIANIKLTCANTNNLVPYLQIVNEILEETLAKALKTNDVYLDIAKRFYPFNLPFNLPLTQIRTYLKQNNTSLADIYRTMDKESGLSIASAREYLNISQEELANFKKPEATDITEVLSKNYGLTITSGDLANLSKVDTFISQVGISLNNLRDLLYQNLNPEEIFNISGEYTAKNMQGDTITFTQKGSSVSGTCNYNNGKITIQGSVINNVVQGTWNESDNGLAGYCEFTFSDDCSSFNGHWNKGMGQPWDQTTWDGTRKTGTTPATGGIIPHNFFINNVFSSPSEYLSIELNVSDPDNEYYEIANLDIKALDTLNRFIRVSQKLGWSYTDLDWLLLSIGSRDISDNTFIELAKVKKLETDYSLPINLLVTLWYDIKTIGIGTGQFSAALFDSTFNGPEQIGFTDNSPYHPIYPAGYAGFVNPLYQSKIETWYLNKNSGLESISDSIGNTIISGIPASTDAIRQVAVAAFGDVAAIDLTVGNLSILYRHTMLAKGLNIQIKEYLVLLKLLGITNKDDANLISPSLIPDQVLMIVETLKWIRVTGLNAFTTDYICNGTTNAYVNTGFEEKNIPSLVKTLNIAIQNTLLKPDNFSGNGIPADVSQEIFSWLLSNGYIDNIGLVSNSTELTIDDLTGKTDFELTNDQIKSIVSITDNFRQNQEKSFNTNLAAFFGLKEDFISLVIEQVQTLLKEPNYLQHFIISDLFALSASSILKDENKPDLDHEKVKTAFKANNIILSDQIQIIDQANNAWKITNQQNNSSYYGYQNRGDSNIGFFTKITQNSSENLVFVDIFIKNISRFSIFYKSFSLNNTQINGIIGKPDAYNQIYSIDKENFSITFSIENIYAIYSFIQLELNFNDRKNQLVNYLTNAGTPGYNACAELVEIAGWHKDQCTYLSNYFFGNKVNCTTVNGLTKLNQVFAITQELGIDAYFMGQLNDTGAWENIADNWQLYNEYSRSLLKNIKANSSIDAWPSTFKKMNGLLEEAKRDAMLNLTVWEIGKEYPGITTPDNLYEFLLIDIKRAGCQDISYIKQALNSAQLYLQRCRLNLERNVDIDKADLPDVYWEWIMNYRVWEANREVFLYPENYIDPSLRKSKTDLFKKLENDLSQGNVTKDTVEAAYKKYLDSFQELATLQYVDGYRCYTNGSEDEESDTLFIFARTQAIPYQYYYISRSKGDIWSQWNKIIITINAQYITPVYAFNKLFIFWSEITEVTEKSNSNGKITSSKVSINYSFYNFSGDWVQPQTLIKDRLIFATGCNEFIKKITNSKNEILPPDLFDRTQMCWQKPYAISINKENYWRLDDDRSKSDKIIVCFGSFLDTDSYTEALAIPNITTTDSPCVDFEQFLTDSVEKINQIITTNNNRGYVSLVPSIILENDLNQSFLIYPKEFVLVEKNDPMQYVPSVPIIDDLTNKLYLMNIDSIIYNNYIGHSKLQSNSIEKIKNLNKDSFISTSLNITNQGSETIFSQLVDDGYLDSNGTILIVNLNFADLKTDLTTMLAGQPNEAAMVSFVFQCICNSLGTPVLFSELNSLQDTLFTIINDPYSFVINHGSESFLITNDQSKLHPINTQAKILAAVFNSDSFISHLLNEAGSKNLYEQLQDSGYLDNDGRLLADAQYADTVNVLNEILAGQPNQSVIVQESINILFHQPMFDTSSFQTQLISSDASNTIFTQLKLTGYIDPLGRLNANYSMDDILDAVKSILTGQTNANLIAIQVMSIIINAERSSSIKYFKSISEPTKNCICDYQFNAIRLTTSAIKRLSSVLFSEGIEQMLSLTSQQTPIVSGLTFDRLGPSDLFIIPPQRKDGDQVDFSGPYGNYYWELFFHGPLLVAQILNNNQQFQDAETWLQYIFNPTLSLTLLASDSFETDIINSSDSNAIYSFCKTMSPPFIDGNGFVTKLANKTTPIQLVQWMKSNKLRLQTTIDTVLTTEVLAVLQNNYIDSPLSRYWQFQQFRNHTLETLTEQLTNPNEIYAYDTDPFDPHAIARLRIGAYEKTVVMKYIDNLINWGDSEYKLYTWESITAALMLYIYAYDLLGPRPADIGPYQSEFPVSFSEILQKYDGAAEGIPQFLIDMENVISSSISPSKPSNYGKDVPFNDIEAYFCVPENDTFISYWDTIESRLYNIRHCLNINGVAQPLPLFEPPIDPMALVKAAASGNNVLNVASLIQPNVPPYRFSYMIERAKSLTSTLVQLGGSLLSVLEKNDAEGLSLLQSTNEINILNLTTMVKQQQIQDLQDQLSALQQSLQGAQYRQDYYSQLVSGGLNVFEISDLALRTAAIIPQDIAIGINGISIAGYLAPCIFGFSDGGMKFGDAINAGAQISNLEAEILNQSAGLVATAGNYQRRQEEWQFQKDSTVYDIAQITNQISANQARIAIAQQELSIHQKNIDQSQAVDSYLKSKFTNQDLYQWMISRLSSLYFQTYNLSLTLALQAQAAYQFELDSSDQMITFNYWDNLYKGLLSGESLMMSLQQMESSYIQNNTRQLEIEKTVSISQQFPEEFLIFKWGHNNGKQGRLNFTLSEKLFDFDFPGHYCRKIKSISVSIPAVIGPYQNLNATLTQNSNMTILSANPDAVKYAASKTAPASGAEPTEPPSSVLRQNWVSNQSIAISKGLDDTGMFVLNFNDDRYLPFEGAGAVSTWTLNLPPETNKINFDSISDVIINIKYTAKDGGDAFASQVKAIYPNLPDSTGDYLKAKTFDLKQAFPGSWRQLFSTPPDTNGQQSISFPLTDNFWLTNLANVTVEKLMIQTEVSNNETLQGDNFLQLKGGNGEKSFAITDNFAVIDSNDLQTIGFGVNNKNCTLVFDVNKAPDSITNNSGDTKILDETKLIDMAVVIFYSEKLFL
ncbi:MAG: Tc toxin subunit A-related protein [Methylobacter sp.]